MFPFTPSPDTSPPDISRYRSARYFPIPLRPLFPATFPPDFPPTFPYLSTPPPVTFAVEKSSQNENFTPNSRIHSASHAIDYQLFLFLFMTGNP